MRIIDWSSDVCSSDLLLAAGQRQRTEQGGGACDIERLACHGVSPGWEREGIARRSVGLRRDLQHLAGLDQVGIVELVAVGLEDPVPCARLAVELLGDVRQRVAPLHGVGLLTDGFLGAARAALDRKSTRMNSSN